MICFYPVTDFAQYNIPYNSKLQLDVPHDAGQICNSLDNTAPSRGLVYINDANNSKTNAHGIGGSEELCFSPEADWFYYLGELLEETTTVEFDLGFQFTKYAVHVFDPGNISRNSVFYLLL